jgi:hypothetical protein
MKTKNYFFLFLFTAFIFTVNAQENNSNQNVEIISPTDFYITLPMRDYGSRPIVGD